MPRGPGVASFSNITGIPSLIGKVVAQLEQTIFVSSLETETSECLSQGQANISNNSGLITELIAHPFE
jgi:hypothetical protein